ncbi:MAG: hypothetical protein OEO20_13670 [Gemmatimonadota bacterium]|nr:hypothetical protein [Gemmatimonadota bacterium]MDH3569464.1 hypothetical protein [Gemmatimonadota bacterium]MDH5550956.1 hypothetical protein [Gemmatimonadota bacterium]
MRLPSILLATVALACTDAISSVPETIRLTNKTAGDIAYVAVEQELAALVDPAPQLIGQTVRDRAVRAGETVVADDIMGYVRGSGVVFFIYEVNGSLDDPGVTADFATTVTVTGDALRESRRRVEITNLGP